MNWFSPKLESGETILLKRSGGSRILWIIALILFVFLPLEFGLFLGGEPDGISATRLLGLAAAAGLTLLAVILPLLLGESGWQLAVTSRRLMYRPGGWGADAEEISIGEIESVRHDIAANRIPVQGGTREISLDAELIQPDALNEAIERAGEGA